MAAYIQGCQVRVTGTFTDFAGADTDPTAVTFKIHSPSGIETTRTYGVSGITKTGTGIYYSDITLNEGGIWSYRWVGTGSLVAAGQGTLESIAALP
jgi:hypothetical protein